MKSGWKKKSLGELCEMYQPKTISVKDMVEDGAYPVYGANGVIGRYDQFNHEAPQLLITCRGATCGSVNISEPRSWITGNAMVVRPKNGAIQMRYLEYLFRGGVDISSVITGAAQPQITRTNLAPLEISYPESVVEQQQIVDLLDKVFESIAIVKANTEKNFQNARAVFGSHLEFVFSNRDQGWIASTLGKVYDVRDGTHDSPKYHSTGYPLVTSKNLKREGLSLQDVQLISEEDYRKINERSKVHKGDVLFAMIGTIGNPTIVTVDPSFAIKNVALFRIPNTQSGAFLKYYLGSSWVMSKMMKEAKGTTQKFVGLGYLRGFPINLPPLATQRNVVDKLQEMSAETERLESIYLQKLIALDALKKSLLHQAFTGNL